MINEADTYCGKCIKADVCGMECVYDPATTYCAYRVEVRPHGECKTCKYYVPYRDQFSYENRGDGYCKSVITTSEGQAYINCHDKWYCANYEKEGEAE